MVTALADMDNGIAHLKDLKAEFSNVFQEYQVHFADSEHVMECISE